MYKKVAPMFLVDDVRKAMAWYKDMLGAKLQHNFPDEQPFEWISLLLGEVEIMLADKQSAQRWYSDKVRVSTSPANIIAYIYLEGIDSLYERVEGKVELVFRPADKFYGVREFAIRDPFGFVLIFAEIL